jgi:hypothetical protein
MTSSPNKIKIGAENFGGIGMCLLGVVEKILMSKI